MHAIDESVQISEIIGLENISVTKTEWLHHGNDSTLPQMSWFFFKNDIWRFPLGSNPNYGIELGSSIVFSDSIKSSNKSALPAL